MDRNLLTSMIKYAIRTGLGLSLLSSCGSDYRKPAIEYAISTPMAIENSADGNHFFALNSNANNKYLTGSLLVIDKNGKKIAALELPRLGKVMARSGNSLLIGTSSDSGQAIFSLIDVTDPATPSVARRWETKETCEPWGAAARENYAYFTFSCYSSSLEGNQIFVGEIKQEKKDSTLSLVRNIPGKTPRQALYIDSKRGLLFAFNTDTSNRTPSGGDLYQQDKESWDNYAPNKKDYTPNTTANEIPDSYEKDHYEKSKSLGWEYTSLYQYIVLDLNSIAQENFTFKEHDETLSAKEARWMYFSLADDTESEDSKDNSKKFYRTNFSFARPDPTSEDSFYLAHRGFLPTDNLNDDDTILSNIIKVTIKTGADLAANSKTGETLTFEKVYGYKEVPKKASLTQHHKLNYNGSFQVGITADNSQYIVVNNFRGRGFGEKQRYSITASSLLNAQNPWLEEKSSEHVIQNSYRGVALGANGLIMTTSFYENKLKLFRLENKQITEVETIE